MSNRLYRPDALKKNLKWFAEPFQIRDPVLLQSRRQCEASFPKKREAALAFIATQLARAEARPSSQTIFAWGYAYYLSVFTGFQRYGRNPVSLAMASYWSRSNTEYLRLRFLMEADNRSRSFNLYDQKELVQLGQRLFQAYPDDIMVHGELINAFKRYYKDDKDKEFMSLLSSMGEKYPESFEKIRYQLQGYCWLWQSTRKTEYADKTISIFKKMISSYSTRIYTPAHYRELIAEVERKRDRPKEPVIWPVPPPIQ